MLVGLGGVRLGVLYCWKLQGSCAERSRLRAGRFVSSFLRISGNNLRIHHAGVFFGQWFLVWDSDTHFIKNQKLMICPTNFIYTL